MFWDWLLLSFNHIRCCSVDTELFDQDDHPEKQLNILRSSVDKIHLVCHRKFRTTSFRIQETKKDSSVPYASNTMSLNIDMKMILPVNFTGSHCNSPISWWILGKSSTRVLEVVHQFDSIRWSNQCLHTIEFASSRIQQDCFTFFPSRAQSRSRQRPWQWNIDKLDCATGLSTSTSNLGSPSRLCQRFLSDHWPAFVFPEKLSRCFPVENFLSQIHVVVFAEMNRCPKSGIHEHSANSQIHIQIFHRIAKFSSIDFPDHGEDGLRMMVCVWRYFGKNVSTSLLYPFNFPGQLKNWLRVRSGLLPSFIILGNKFPFVMPDLSLRIVGVFWIFFFFFFLIRRVSRCFTLTRQGMHPLVAIETSTLRRMSLVQHSSCCRVSLKLSGSQDFWMQSDSMRQRNLSQWITKTHSSLQVATWTQLFLLLFVCSWILFAIVEQLNKQKFLVQQKWMKIDKWRSLFHS